MASSSLVSKIQQLGKMLSETKSFDRVLSKVSLVFIEKMYIIYRSNIDLIISKLILIYIFLFFIHCQVRIVSATKGKLSCELTVGEEHANLTGTLHGGLTATIIDSVSTWAIVSAEHPPGVSTDLNIR